MRASRRVLLNGVQAAMEAWHAAVTKKDRKKRRSRCVGLHTNVCAPV